MVKWLAHHVILFLVKLNESGCRFPERTSLQHSEYDFVLLVQSAHHVARQKSIHLTHKVSFTLTLAQAECRKPRTGYITTTVTQSILNGKSSYLRNIRWAQTCVRLLFRPAESNLHILTESLGLYYGRWTKPDCPNSFVIFFMSLSGHSLSTAHLTLPDRSVSNATCSKLRDRM